MSRDPREPVFTDVGWRGSLACHKRGKDIHFNKQINEIGDTSTRRFFLETREHARVPPVFCFLPRRVWNSAKRAMPPSRAEKYAAARANFFSSRSPAA